MFGECYIYGIRVVRPVWARRWTDYTSKVYSKSLDEPCFISLDDKDKDNFAW